MQLISRNRKGFTLIEVLIVVLIIAILSGVALNLLNSGGYRQKARDSQRIADLRKLQTALELYFQDNRIYPSSASWSNASAIAGLSPNYASSLPTDPSGGSVPGTPNPCSDYTGTTYYYGYRTTNPATRYVLTARTETNSSSASACNSLSNWATITSCGAVTSCYGVQNP